MTWMRSRLATLRRAAKCAAKVAICSAVVYMGKLTMPKPKEVNSDIAAIRKWISEEPHLPKDLDDFLIKKFLHSCYGSLERTKHCITNFSANRRLMPEIYTSRNLDSKEIQRALDISYVTSQKAGDYEILIYHIDDPGLEKFVFLDCLKSFTIQVDVWLQHFDVFPKGHIVIMDARNLTMKAISKINISYLRNFIVYLLEAFPIRVIEVHVVNCPLYIEAIYSLLKPAVPVDIQKMVNFYSGVEELHKVIDKQFLPEDYGGDAPSLRQQQLDRIQIVWEKRDMFLDDNMWKMDVTIRSKSKINNDAFNDSWRTLQGLIF